MSRCELPFYPDPGQPVQPQRGQKLYLVMGTECDAPGAYVSWPSAGTQYNKYSSATLKTYFQWSEAQSAWWAGCDRGEHRHPTQPEKQKEAAPRRSPAVPMSPSPHSARAPAPTTSPRAARRTPNATEPVPVFIIHSRTPSPVPGPSNVKPGSRHRGTPEAPPSPAKRNSKQKPAPLPARSTPLGPPTAPTGRTVYAVRALDDPTGGVVFSDLGEARAWYHAKHDAGLMPTMVTSHSLTTAVNFAERFPEAATDEGQRRRAFVEEENRARRRKVDLAHRRAKERREIMEKLEAVREDCGESSGDSADESDVSRSTSSLASELEGRYSYGNEWRYYRSGGEHGKT
ncbi:hypothetical protein C8F04DRAFT_1258047 [Mycena alexandri]|uniref:Uncharacterized protein n=1 Tax=Mycena alexandri TaxID=1745969 RepID=A0AAD6SZR0_9AGAR|nr:hypothetical protein C8F04DRAFT_1258047 [Mycena alexandri]